MLHSFCSEHTDPEEPELLLIGGGGNCFSFGTHFNRQPVTVDLRPVLGWSSLKCFYEAVKQFKSVTKLRRLWIQTLTIGHLTQDEMVKFRSGTVWVEPTTHQVLLLLIPEVWLSALSKQGWKGSEGIKQLMYGKIQRNVLRLLTGQVFIGETSVQNHKNKILVKYLYFLLMCWMEVKSFSEAPEGLDRGTNSTPVARLAVFPLLQEVLPSAVVGVLIENPPAIKDFAGVDLPPAELLQKWGTVLCGLEDLTPEVCLLIQLHLVQGPTGLQGDRSERGGWWGDAGRWQGVKMEDRCREVAGGGWCMKSGGIG